MSFCKFSLFVSLASKTLLDNYTANLQWGQSWPDLSAFGCKRLYLQDAFYSYGGFHSVATCSKSKSSFGRTNESCFAVCIFVEIFAHFILRLNTLKKLLPTYDLAKTSLIGKLITNCTNGWPLLTVKLFTRHGNSAVRIDKIILNTCQNFIVCCLCLW
jgi:hypothetical protein